MKLFLRKVSYMFWKYLIFFYKKILRLAIFQLFLVFIKTLKFKTFFQKKSIELNHFYIFLIRINDQNIKFLDRTINSIKYNHKNNFKIYLICESTLFTENSNMSYFKNMDYIEIFFNIKDMLQVLDFLVIKNNEDFLFTWIKPGDIFSCCAFEKLEKSINENQKGVIFYFDWITKTEKDKKFSPICFPDTSVNLLYSINFLENAFFRLQNIVWKDLAKSILYFEENFAYDIVGNSIGQLVHISEFLCQRNGYNYTLPPTIAVKAFNNNVVSVTTEDKVNHIYFDCKIAKTSIIIPSSDNYYYLSRCVNSILQSSVKDNFEIIILDNSKSDPIDDMKSALSSSENVKIYHLSSIFNYSAFNNFGSKMALGENLIFLNDDIEVIDNNWLNEILQWLDQPKVGIVGGCLSFPDSTIQHAGIVIGLIGHAGNIFRNFDPRIHFSPFGSINWYRNYYAVTGACLGIKKCLFDEVGGFNENYQLVYSDVALGVEVNNAGFDVIYNPFLRMIHHEGKTRRQYVNSHDLNLFEKEYGKILYEGDKFYNKRLSYLSFDPKLKCESELSPLSRIEKLRR